jgi:PAB1-binding protein PBP1
MNKSATRNAWSKPLAAPPGIVDKTPVNNVMRERFLHLQLSLVGQKVTMTLTNGAVIDGILHTFTPFESMAKDHRNKYVIKAAHVVKGEVDIKGGTLIIGSDKVSNLHVKSIRLEQSSRAADSFQTDTDISSGGASVKDELVMAGNAWTSAGAEVERNGRAGLFGTKIGDLNGKIGQWDQFQANEKKFGVKASFDENLYTTSLDKSTVDKKKQEEAERLAREIESQATSNMHLAEERGQVVEGDYDEEDLYSGVLVAEKGAKEIKERNKLVLKPRTVQNTNSDQTTKPIATVPTGQAPAAINPAPAPKKMNWAAMVAKSDAKKASITPKQTKDEKSPSSKDNKVQIKKEILQVKQEDKVQIKPEENTQTKLEEKKSEEKLQMKPDEKIEKTETVEKNSEEKLKAKPKEDASITIVPETEEPQKKEVPETERTESQATVASQEPMSTPQNKEEKSVKAEDVVSATEPEKPKSKLNANAKSFTFNPAAKSFTPTFNVPTPSPSMHQAPMDPQLSMMQGPYMQFPGAMPGPMMYPPTSYHPQMHFRQGVPTPYGMMHQQGGPNHLSSMPGQVPGEDTPQSTGEGADNSSASTEDGNKLTPGNADHAISTNEGEEINHEPDLDQQTQVPPQQVAQHVMHGMPYPGGPGYYAGGMPMGARGPGQQHYHPHMVGAPQQMPGMPRNFMFQVPPQHMHQANIPHYSQMRGPGFPGQPYMQGGYPGHPMEGDEMGYRGGRGGRSGRGNRRPGRGRGSGGGRGKFINYNNPNQQRNQDSASDNAEVGTDDQNDNFVSE